MRSSYLGGAAGGFVMAGFLAACGGGGGDSGTPVVAPTISSQPQNQSILTSGAASFSVAATGAGLDPGTTFDVLTRFVPSLAVRRAGYLQDRHEPTMFAVRDLQKDLHLALNLFQQVEADVPLTALVREWIDEAATKDADLDISAVIRRYAPSPGIMKQDGHGAPSCARPRAA